MSSGSERIDDYTTISPTASREGVSIRKDDRPRTPVAQPRSPSLDELSGGDWQAVDELVIAARECHGLLWARGVYVSEEDWIGPAEGVKFCVEQLEIALVPFMHTGEQP